MENKTAVDWLRERLPSLFEHDDNGFYAKIFEEAKEMEKEQIIQTFHEARIKFSFNFLFLDNPN